MPKNEPIVKIKVSWTIDSDVLQALKETADGQRDNVSSMANRMLAVGLGLMPRMEDRKWSGKS
jgi:hypothetical protein